MGKDKALAPFLGRPLIERVLGRVAPLADEVVVTTNSPDGYRFLGVRLVSDLVSARGALGGLFTALSAARHPMVAVVACDMPFVSADLLAVESHLLVSSESDAVIPITSMGMEPFHAVYRRATCLPAVHAAIYAQKWRVDAWFDDVRIVFLPPEEILRYDPRQIAFWNLNTPEELRQAERMAVKMEQE